jgi:hypothetical protein
MRLRSRFQRISSEGRPPKFPRIMHVPPSGHWLQASEGGPWDSPCTDATRVVNEAMTADRVTWAGDRTLAWRPEPTFVPLHDVTMRRMAANLLVNALEAAVLSGRVSTEVSSQAGRMLLAIEAKGPGLGRLPKGSGPPCRQWHARLLSTTGTRLRPRQPLVNLQLPRTMRRMGKKVAGATCPV